MKCNHEWVYIPLSDGMDCIKCGEWKAMNYRPPVIEIITEDHIASPDWVVKLYDDNIQSNEDDIYD